MEQTSQPFPLRQSSALDYIRIARPDHWFKNIFIIPGVLIGALLGKGLPESLFINGFLGIVSACLIASANYVINEWLDRHFDRHHPKKRLRPSVMTELNGVLVYTEYVLLAAVGLACAWMISPPFFCAAGALLTMGIVYNVRPFRTKDRIYLDVLSESINNPIRFLMGWFLVETYYLPPSSILLAYWMGGAFLMGIKRFAEFRQIGDPGIAGRYRRSFQSYNENSLLISSFFYALSASFFLGIFLIKYRIEYLLTFPLFAGLFAWYLQIGLSADSVAQSPEKLYRQKRFIAYLFLLGGLILLLTLVDMPWLSLFLKKSLIKNVWSG